MKFSYLQMMGLALCTWALFVQGTCNVSFKGVSIAPDVKTYYVENFTNQAANSVPTLAPDFTELLKNKIRRDSPLTEATTDPDVEFSGYISNYSVTAQAPQPGETIGFNRLNMVVRVEFTNNKHEDKSYSKNFPFFADFDGSSNLLDVQDDLIATITTQIVEDIFIASFSNW